MKMYLISDNVDTLTGMRLAGVDGIVVHEREELRQAIEKAMNDIMFEIPSRDDIVKCIITKETIENGQAPTLIVDENKDANSEADAS